MFKNILVPTDGSALSRRGVKRAVQLAKEQKARITGFFVGPEWAPPLHGEYVTRDFVTPQQHNEKVRKLADHVLGAVKNAAAAAGVPCKCTHVTGAHPYREILKAAKSNHCDVIVMASHGRRGISRLLLGSETSKVLAHSTIPVMVVK